MDPETSRVQPVQPYGHRVLAVLWAMGLALSVLSIVGGGVLGVAWLATRLVAHS
jgi:hypothetical protein